MEDKKYYYKMRAEFLTDIANFILVLVEVKGASCWNVKIEQQMIETTIGAYCSIPDTVMTFTSNMERNALIEIIAKIDDWHTMAETLQEEHLYTGERLCITCSECGRVLPKELQGTMHTTCNSCHMGLDKN